MPSPIAHAAAGYAIYKFCEAHYPQKASSRIGLVPRLLVATVGLSLLPDLDFVPGLLVKDFDRFHNNVTHSLFLGLIVACIIGLAVRLKNREDFTFWFVLALVCYESHVIMDFFTVGRGALLFWPFSLERYQPPFMLFYGLHRSDGWFSMRHVWTLLTETAFAIIIFVFVLARRVFVSARLIQPLDDQIPP